MNLTASDLWECYNALPASSPVRDKIRPRLADDVLARLRACRSRETGTLDGRPVHLDNRGAYSSGYWCWDDAPGYPDPDTWDRIERTPDTPEDRVNLAVRRGLLKIVQAGRNS